MAARSTSGGPPPDASTLGVTGFNVGMPQKDNFLSSQDSKVEKLAAFVKEWLEEGPVVVGLNEIHHDIAEKLVMELRKNNKVDVEIATHETNCVLWRTPP